jgi:hypothetical protein
MNQSAMAILPKVIALLWLSGRSLHQIYGLQKPQTAFVPSMARVEANKKAGVSRPFRKRFKGL